MLTNYHTHTNRCHHAEGEDEEYVKSAIKMGYSILGFSDHAPFYYPDGYVSYYKMLPSKVTEYARSIFSLREKYSDKIRLHLGFEAEYYPELFAEGLKLWQSVGAEYIILGQHFIECEYSKNEHSFGPSTNEKLRRYTDRCIEAIETEKFSYIAHPDVINYVGDDEKFYEHEVKRLVECANRHETPLEINMLGLYEGRHYPNRNFWRIAAGLNPKVILGTDAHSPLALENMNVRRQAEKLAKDCGLNLIDKFEFKTL